MSSLWASAAPGSSSACQVPRAGELRGIVPASDEPFQDLEVMLIWRPNLDIAFGVAFSAASSTRRTAATVFEPDGRSCGPEPLRAGARGAHFTRSIGPASAAAPHRARGSTKDARREIQQKSHMRSEFVVGGSTTPRGNPTKSNASGCRDCPGFESSRSDVSPLALRNERFPDGGGRPLAPSMRGPYALLVQLLGDFVQ
jgi:hypothetical protein